ncbi:hypothetical protein U5801_01495 [Lamprobacter modestohalophilus]|uniref:hypothetical protein n=1 Tax=Lamprobacter modestohalophilus TaxID=1064514 RepID=UPI002ADEE26B|nr:hypothetical protein [Lamprobacter modestohalophilus]MEA1048498.1 hypothetical protein [Lamprobacter modestohalophilus]
MAAGASRLWPHRASQCWRLLPMLSLGLLLGTLGQSLSGEPLDPLDAPDPATAEASASASAENQVLGIDLSALDADGLIGPADGKRSLSYEFCIPSGQIPAAEVQRIDPSAQFFIASRGRIGCAPDQTLVIGHTHQLDFASILQQLTSLPYVERIVESHFE